MKYQDSPVIEKPELKTPLRKSIEIAVTSMAWILWLYLFMPIITLILWAVGLQVVLEEQIFDEAWNGIRSVIPYYVAIIAALWLVMQGWSMYNRARFRGHDRRKSVGPVSENELAAYFGVSAESLDNVKKSRSTRVSFKDQEICLSSG